MYNVFVKLSYAFSCSSKCMVKVINVMLLQLIECNILTTVKLSVTCYAVYLNRKVEVYFPLKVRKYILIMKYFAL